MKYIRTSAEFEPFAGFLHRPEKPGFTTIVAGPAEIYGADKTGSELNQFPCQRIQMSIHRWPPGKAHGSHHHKYWEQLYYIFIFEGQAEITVGDEKKVVGPGSAAYMPPQVEHDIVAVGNETLVATVLTCLLDDDRIGEQD